MATGNGSATAGSILSAKFNLVCEQATTFNFRFQILNDQTPWNLSTYTATMTVRPFAGSSTTTLVASTTNGYLTFDPLNGRVIVTVPASVTAAISAGRFVYDLVLTTGATTTRILEGKFIVTPAVTT